MKRLNIIGSLLMGALLLTACQTDRDDNPRLDLTKGQEPITLNTPAFAGSTYDLDNTEYIRFNCTQPAYGFPATVTYVVQLSVDADMTDPVELSTTYSLNDMEVSGRDIAIATTKQLMQKKNKKQDEFPVETPLYVRIRAYISGVEGTEALSNIVKLNSVKTKFALPDVEVPNPFYVCGNFTGNDWEKSMATAAVNGAPESQWRIAWIDGDGVKVSPTMSEADYSADMIETSYVCKTEGFKVSDTGVVTATTPGWYVMLIDGEVDNDKRTMLLTFSFYEPELWLIGPSIINADAGITSDNCWNEAELRDNYAEYVKISTPTTMDGEFVSPALTSTTTDGDGGSRAYVKIKNYEWWKTEFFIYDKKIVYRGNGGEVRPYTCGGVGQVVRFNFSNDSGELQTIN